MEQSYTYEGIYKDIRYKMHAEIEPFVTYKATTLTNI